MFTYLLTANSPSFLLVFKVLQLTDVTCVRVGVCVCVCGGGGRGALVVCARVCNVGFIV